MLIAFGLVRTAKAKCRPLNTEHSMIAVTIASARRPIVRSYSITEPITTELFYYGAVALQGHTITEP